MRRDLLDILRCPVDKAELTLEAVREESGEVLHGSLTCAKCGFRYPIEDGIPNLLPPELQRPP
ncbi:MAG: methytransferase partner Trm112 [Methanobacteriota archaeon]